MPVAAIIVAGGKGERLGGATPKQFLPLGNRTILQRSVAAFDAHPLVDRIVVVLPAKLDTDATTLVGLTSKPCVTTTGGERRQDSVRNGLARVDRDIDVVLVHDAARPFASAALIERVIGATRRTGAAVPAMSAKDTVKFVPAGDSLVQRTIPRGEIWLAQTPQGFRRSVLELAVSAGDAHPNATDEAMLVEATGGSVEVVPGDEHNVKITTNADLNTARRAAEVAPRVGTGYDLHRLVSGRPLVLAGVVVPFDRGPLGHSDGDVISHSVVDAILGAAALGDIGQHFSNTDPRWKDMPGEEFLRRAAAIVGERGWRVANVDVTVVLERPKLAPHVHEIRARIASALGIDAGLVSVKGKTNEGVDAVGRGEAIAAHAVAVLAIGGPDV